MKKIQDYFSTNIGKINYEAIDFKLNQLNYLPCHYLCFPMVKDVIILLLGGVYNRLVLDSDGVNPFNLDRVKARKHLHRVHHVSYLLQTLAERVKFTKDVVLTELKLPLIRVLSELFLGSLELFLVLLVQLDALVQSLQEHWSVIATKIHIK